MSVFKARTKIWLKQRLSPLPAGREQQHLMRGSAILSIPGFELRQDRYSDVHCWKYCREIAHGSCFNDTVL